jgi:arginase
MDGNTLVIGGDHSIAIGSVLSSIAKNKSETCVIWIDAHPDIHTTVSSESGNLHGMPLSFITGYEPKWNWTNSIKKLDTRHLYYFGIRDIDHYEELFIKSHNIKILENIHEIIKVIELYENVHLSFDVDALDPEYMSSTGTRAEGGIPLCEIVDLFQNLPCDKCISMDICEYNPLLGSPEEKKSPMKLLNLSLIRSMHKFLYFI